MKAIVSEICTICGKNPSYYGCHGVRDKAVYSEYHCVSCYAERHHVSKERAEDLQAEVEAEASKPRRRRKPKEIKESESAPEPIPSDPVIP